MDRDAYGLTVRPVAVRPNRLALEGSVSDERSAR